MKNGVKRLAKRFLYNAGYYSLTARVRGPRPPRLVVLMYHDVLDDASRSPADDTDTESPTSRQFAAHIEQVARRYRVLSLRDAVAEMRQGGLRRDSVAITFDDGYTSVHTTAYPVLRRLGVPATLFVLTGWINREGHMWWQELRTFASRSTFSPATVRRVEEILGQPLSPVNGGRSTVHMRRRFLELTEPWLRGLDEATIAFRLDELREATLPGMTSLSVRNQALTWDQLREMSDGGVELGAHTHSHINLRHSDRDTAVREIVKSKEEIERRTGARAVGFAYPYGKDVDHYATAAQILREHGFTYACTAVTGTNDGATDVFYLRRIVLPATTSRGIINRELAVAFLRGA